MNNDNYGQHIVCIDFENVMNLTVSILDRLSTDMDNDETSINIYLDLSKASDTLNHNILFQKLEYYGVKDNSLKLFKLFNYYLTVKNNM